MAYRTPFAIGEWYHCYNRGVEKRRVFTSRRDYERFQTLMYACNNTSSVRVSDRRKNSLLDILQDPTTAKGDHLVEIGAYSLMPNHIHFLLREKRKRGIPLFMQKVFTGYTMYFNIKYERTGALFSGVFKSKHIHNDSYLKTALSYILLNPAELFEPRWKSGRPTTETVQKYLMTYRYSSLMDFFGVERLEKKIVGTDWNDYFEKTPTLNHILENAKEYYASLPKGFALEQHSNRPTR